MMDGDQLIDNQARLPLLIQPIVSYSSAYESLRIPDKSRSIRLLSLKSSKDFDAPLIGSLQLVSLDDPDCPPFNALSYAWGTFASPKDTLKCGTRDFQITSNCQDALRQLRSLYGAITIWVDAICIDQMNDEEKQHQISLMREIYMRAKRVYFWIGKETPALKRAIKCLEEAAPIDRFPIYPGHADKFSSKLFRKASFYLKTILWVLKLVSPYIYFQVWLTRLRVWILLQQYQRDDFNELFNQEWFLRVWTFQETVLAYDSVMVCGSVTISWDMFVRGFRCVYYFCTFFQPSPLEATMEPTSKGKEPIKYFRKAVLRSPVFDQVLPHIPQSFRTFGGVIDLWTRVKRPDLMPLLKHSSVDSVYEYRKTYRGTQMYFLPKAITPTFTTLTGASVYIFILVFVATTRNIFFVSRFVGITCLIIFNLVILASLTQNKPKDDKEDTVALLEGVTQVLRHREATDPKDKVFALYGVLESFGIQLTKPDYGRSQTQIYHELFMVLLCRSPLAIVLLLDAGRDPSCTEDVAIANALTPSWVPNWDRRTNLKIPNDYFQAIPDSTTRFSSKISLRQAPSKLIVHGQLKGRIKFCGETFEKIDLDAAKASPDNAPLRNAVKIFITLISLAKDPDFAFQSRPEFFWGVEDWDRKVRGRKPLKSSLCADNSMHLKPRRQLLALGEQARITKDMYQFFHDRRAIGPDKYSDLVMHNITWDLTKDKRLLNHFIDLVNIQAGPDYEPYFVTSHGYSGHGSQRIAAGDWIAHVDGVPAPLILRRHGAGSLDESDTWTVISAATISGAVPDESDYIGEIILV